MSAIAVGPRDSQVRHSPTEIAKHAAFPPVPDIDSLIKTHQLSGRDEFISMVRRFIDVQHWDAAAHHICKYYGLNSHKDAEPYLYEFYTDVDVNDDAREFSIHDFKSFIVAHKFVEALAHSVEPLSVNTIFKLSSLVLEGDLSHANHAISRKREISVYRSVFDFRDVFDHEGKYLSEIPGFDPDFVGFYKRTDRNEKIIVKPIPGSTQFEPFETTVHGALDRLRRSGDEAALILKEALKTFIKPSPYQITFENDEVTFCSLIFSLSPDKMLSALNRIVDFVHKEEDKILNAVQNKNLKIESDEFVRGIVTTAARAARAVDITHFRENGSGRTSLLVERLILLTYGIDCGDSIDGYHWRKTLGYGGLPGYEFYRRENGTYCSVHERVDALLMSLKKNGGINYSRCRKTIASKLSTHD